MISPREALEAALVRTPDDTALHMAYADCLIEDGDPRGEYVRLCLAAEEPSATKKERKRRREQAEAFLHRHEAAWLGDLAEFLLSPDESRRRIGSRPRVMLEWRRGWIVGITCYGIRRDLADALQRLRYTDLLETLAIDANSYRTFNPGPRDDGDDFSDPDGRNPYRLIHDWPRSALKRLLIQDTNFGDFGLGYLFSGPYFATLRSLSLTNCSITDEGAAMLAKHPHTPELESLRLEQNLLSPLGIEMLAEVGVRVSELQRFGRLEDVS